MNSHLIWWNFWKKGHEFCHLWEISHFGTGIQIGVVPVPFDRTKMVTVPRQSGTGTTASCNPGFGILTLLSSNSNTEGIRTLIND